MSFLQHHDITGKLLRSSRTTAQYVEEEPEIYEQERSSSSSLPATMGASCYSVFLDAGMREQEVIYATVIVPEPSHRTPYRRHNRSTVDAEDVQKRTIPVPAALWRS